jgi:hypothetical protein
VGREADGQPGASGEHTRGGGVACSCSGHDGGTGQEDDQLPQLASCRGGERVAICALCRSGPHKGGCT